MSKMPLRFDPDRSLPEQVSEWLDEAALTLAALPATGLRPAGAGSTWPDYVRDLEDLGWDRESDDFLPRPTADQVERLDIVLTWVPMIEDRKLRIVVNMRLIVHRISGRHKWEWRKIGAKMGVDYKTAQAWHQKACADIAKKIRPGAFFTSQTPQFADM
ncbi:hypothetical protein HW511_00305 [Asaia siamensis]|uniref:DUF6362 domain-containing protein n=1 Tax=Asaia siamensis TaxID=110479 RepID=A0ABQ1M3P7_9PROT|nr:DUF6362 family protein [Asaia siamensis]GBR06373.1 hypothetical protein AA0323_1372 [Asaia siamensis NRIC 0323]GGC34266.1 hypothetical protein GCM10007207_19790 [Asaia siamensis]